MFEAGLLHDSGPGMETRREILRESEPARPRWVPTPPPPPGPWERFWMLLRRSVFPLALILFVGAVLVFLVRLPGFGGATISDSLGISGAAEEAEEESAVEDEAASEGDPAAEGEPGELIPLTVESEPAGATVLIDGEEVGQTPLQGLEMESGAYILSLEMENYSMPDTLVVLSGETTSSFTFRMRALSQEPDAPPAAEEQQPEPEPEPQQDAEPDELPVAEEQAPADPPAEEEPSAEPGEEGALDEDLSVSEIEELFSEEDFALGDIVVSSEPSGATVLLNGVRRGTTPLTLADLQIGPKEITLQMEGYQEYTEEVEVEAEEIHGIEAELEPVQGQLRVLARPWGSIYIDGELHESETNVRYTVDLPVGTYTVRAEHPSLGSQEQEVTIREGEVTSLVLNLNE